MKHEAFRKMNKIFCTIALFLSVLTFLPAASDSGDNVADINVSQDFHFDIANFEYFEIGFKDADGNISSSPVSLAVNADGIAVGKVSVYWDIRTENSFAITMKRSEPLTSSNNNYVGWDISETAVSGVISDYSNTVPLVSSDESLEGLREYKNEGKSFNIFTEPLNGKEADSDYEAALVIEITAGGTQ